MEEEIIDILTRQRNSLKYRITEMDREIIALENQKKATYFAIERVSDAIDEIKETFKNKKNETNKT